MKLPHFKFERNLESMKMYAAIAVPQSEEKLEFHVFNEIFYSFRILIWLVDQDNLFTFVDQHWNSIFVNQYWGKSKQENIFAA